MIYICYIIYNIYNISSPLLTCSKSRPIHMYIFDVCVCVCIYTYIYIRRVHIHTHSTHVYVYVYMYKYISIHTYGGDARGRPLYHSTHMQHAACSRLRPIMWCSDVGLRPHTLEA